MKKLIVVLFFFMAFVSNAQNLVVEGTAPNLYITHLVAPKENFYSIGRLYNQAPKSIASFNSLVMEKGLSIGQKIKIPLNSANIDASGNGSIPLTHIVAKSESLFKIGTDHNVTAAQIRQWNNLSSDNIAQGTPLVVGHLKAGAAAAAVASAPVAVTQPEVKTLVVEPKKEVITEKPASTEKAVTTTQLKKEEPFTTLGAEPVNINTNIPVIEETPKEKEPVVKVQEKKTDAPKGYGVTDESTKQTKPVQPVAKEETFIDLKPAPITTIRDSPVRTEEPARNTNAENKRRETSMTENVSSIEGAFAGIFRNGTTEKSLNTKSGEAATFKSTSGWQDKKYYVLMNDVTPGTVLKITSAENKVVYAKVLGSMPEMKENNGVLIRISNAAASYLGIIDPKFPVQISYYQ